MICAAVIRIKNCKKPIKYSVCALIAAAVAVGSFFQAGATLAYDMIIDGEKIATVSSKSVFDGALSIVRQRVRGGNVELLLGSPDYSLTVSSKSSIADEPVVAEAIIDKNENIVYAAELTVNGNPCVRADRDDIENALNEYKNSFNVDGAECSNEFLDRVLINDGYYFADSLDEPEQIKSAVSCITVKTTARAVTDTEIAYKSVTKKTSEQVAGYSEVTTAGKNGINRVAEEIILINGEEQSREQVSNEVVSEPVNEVVTVGTAKNTYTAQASAAGHSSGFVFPLPSGVWQVSAYYGDGRGHKGTDLRAPKGTSVFAVAGGRVIESKYDGDFGNCIKIDHGNGLVTLYAHASQLCVKVGDTVNAGDVIALVGSTGNSTGNHLHFSVLSGGKYVDPAPYIGLD